MISKVNKQINVKVIRNRYIDRKKLIETLSLIFLITTRRIFELSRIVTEEILTKIFLETAINSFQYMLSRNA